MKCCTKCGVEKPLSEYYKEKKNKDGLRNSCKECTLSTNREYQASNKDKISKQRAQYREKNRDSVSQSKKLWYQANADHVKQKSKRSYHSNKAVHHARRKLRYQAKLAEERAVRAAYYYANKERFRGYGARRRCAERNAIPPWFEERAVTNVYHKAAEYGFHVDHIVPLQGKTVCGLHCWANLQLLDPVLNSQKGNREWPDMP